jgi:hypothetical protein
MRLHQVNFRYDPEQDRLALRMATADGREFRLCLTRRFVGLLWPVLQKLLAEDLRRRRPADAHAADAVMAFEQERVLAQTDFQTPFGQGGEAPPSFPLGAAPLLLSRIQVKRRPEGPPLLCLHPAEGAGLEFPAGPQLLHLLCQGLRQTVEKADWNLELPEGTAPSSDPNRVLH